MAAGTVDTPQVETERIRLGFWLIIIAFAFIGLVVLVATLKFSASSDVVAVVGSVTTAAGTLAGAFFGVQAGASGKQQAQHDATEAHKRLAAVLDAAPTGIMRDAKSMHPEAFE